jgi:hypothetical protein
MTDNDLDDDVYEHFCKNFDLIKFQFITTMLHCNNVEFSSGSPYYIEQYRIERMLSMCDVFAVVQVLVDEYGVKLKTPLDCLAVKLKSMSKIYNMFPNEEEPFKDSNETLTNHRTCEVKLFDLKNLYLCLYLINNNRISSLSPIFSCKTYAFDEFKNSMKQGEVRLIFDYLCVGI